MCILGFGAYSAYTYDAAIKVLCTCDDTSLLIHTYLLVATGL